MTSSLDVHQKQRAVIEFLPSEGEPTKKIFERLVKVYGDTSIAYSTVKKWISWIKDEEDDPSLSSLQDRRRSGRPSSTDRRITIDDIAKCVGVSHGSAVNIVNELGFAKVCARWVPRQLLDFHKQARFEACSELIECHKSDKTFLSRIVTGDETWVHHYESESKRSSMEWRHPTSPRVKKFKSQRSAGKIMATVFWDIEGVILVDFMPKGTTINSDVYIDTLRKLKARLRRVRPHLDMSKVLLQHDNARPHTSLKTREVIASFGWTTVTHPPYSPDLAPSDYHLFGPLKEGVRGQHFTIQFNLFSQTQPSAGGLQRKTNWSSNVCCTQSHWNLHRKICRNGLQRWTNKHFKTYTSIYKYDGQVVLYERADNYLHK